MSDVDTCVTRTCVWDIGAKFSEPQMLIDFSDDDQTTDVTPSVEVLQELIKEGDRGSN